MNLEALIRKRLGRPPAEDSEEAVLKRRREAKEGDELRS